MGLNALTYLELWLIEKRSIRCYLLIQLQKKNKVENMDYELGGAEKYTVKTEFILPLYIAINSGAHG